MRVGIAADGAPCNNRLDAFTEMRLAALIQKPQHGAACMTAGQVLRMATRGGAEILGLEDEIGSIEPGKRADITVVALTSLHLTPVDDGDVTGAIVFAATPEDVRHTVVDGRVLVENRRLVEVDAARVTAEAKRHLQACLTRAGLAR